MTPTTGVWDVVVASNARFSGMVRRTTTGEGDLTDPTPRVIDRKTTRRLYGWSHYAFNQRLASAAVRRGVYVHWTSEDGTSRTCGRCGGWHADLGAAEVFRCPTCALVVNRDINGARNNLLCALTALKTHV